MSVDVKVHSYLKLEVPEHTAFSILNDLCVQADLSLTGGDRWNEWNTLYYDTSALDLYRAGEEVQDFAYVVGDKMGHSTMSYLGRVTSQAGFLRQRCVSTIIGDPIPSMPEFLLDVSSRGLFAYPHNSLGVTAIAVGKTKSFSLEKGRVPYIFANIVKVVDFHISDGHMHCPADLTLLQIVPHPVRRIDENIMEVFVSGVWERYPMFDKPLYGVALRNLRAAVGEKLLDAPLEGADSELRLRSNDRPPW